MTCTDKVSSSNLLTAVYQESFWKPADEMYNVSAEVLLVIFYATIKCKQSWIVQWNYKAVLANTWMNVDLLMYTFSTTVNHSIWIQNPQSLSDSQTLLCTHSVYLFTF